MKIGAVLAMASVAAAAGSIAPRDTAKAQESIASITKDVEDLREAVINYDGDKEPVLKIVDSLNSHLKEGTAMIKSGKDLSIDEAMSFQKPVEKLAKRSEALAVALIKNKERVESTGACFDVQSSIQTIMKNSKEMIDSFVDKVPFLGKGTANGIASPIEAAMKNAKNSYKNCNQQTDKPADDGKGSNAKPAAAVFMAEVPAADYKKPTSTASIATSLPVTTKVASTKVETTKVDTATTKATTVKSKSNVYAKPTTGCVSQVPGTARPTAGVRPGPAVVPGSAGSSLLHVPVGLFALAVAALAL